MFLSRAVAVAALALALVGCQQQGQKTRTARICQCECTYPKPRSAGSIGQAVTPAPIATPAPVASLAPVTGSSFSGARFHIGVMTGAASRGEEAPRGAEQLIRDYGSVTNGGMIQHITYPDSDSGQREAVTSSLLSLSGDPLMKVIVVDRVIPGVSEALKRIKAKRPDILLLSGSPIVDHSIAQKAADLVVDNDFAARGYSIIWEAKQMGAGTFVHISFPRHLSIESLNRRRAVFAAASKEMGLRFVSETAPDPSSATGIAGAQRFILENVPQWLQEYGAGGKKVAFFCTSDVHTEPLLKQLLASNNGIFIEASYPSPLVGYPEALSLDLSREPRLPMADKYPTILKKIEEVVIAKGGAGRFGTSAFSFGASLTAGLAEFGKNVVEAKAERTSLKDLFAAFEKYTPGIRWNGDYYLDVKTGSRAHNEVLVSMDTYILGRGIVPTTQQKVPAKYRTIRR